MGQVLKKDKIGALSENSGTITLEPSVLTVGGQQYQTSTLTRLIADDVTLTAVTRYQIYAVVDSSNVVLRISTNENSVGPSGFTSWKLVGSFYSDGLSSVGFGDFVNITGTPETGPIPFEMEVQAVTTDPSKSNSPDRDEAFFVRNGRKVSFSYNFQASTGTGGTAGSGTYMFQLPGNLSIDFDKTHTADTAAGLGVVGSCSFRTNATDEAAGYSRLYQAGGKEGISIWGIVESGGNGVLVDSTTAYVFTNSGLHYSFNADDIPVQGWDNVAIEDL